MDVNKIKKGWLSENVELSTPASEKEILLFQEKNNVKFPADLIDYFRIAGGTNDGYDHKFFRFFSINQFQTIDKHLNDFAVGPGCVGIAAAMRNYKNYYVICDYMFKMFVYCIFLDDIQPSKNEILVVSGNAKRKIANSFNEFIDLYINDSILLQMGE